MGAESISEKRARTRRPRRGLTFGTFRAGTRGETRRRTRSTTFTPQTSEVGDPLSGGGGAVHASNRAGVDIDINFASETALPKCSCPDDDEVPAIDEDVHVLQLGLDMLEESLHPHRPTEGFPLKLGGRRAAGAARRRGVCAGKVSESPSRMSKYTEGKNCPPRAKIG